MITKGTRSVHINFIKKMKKEYTYSGYSFMGAIQEVVDTKVVWRQLPYFLWLVLTLIMTNKSYAQVATNQAGDWNTAANWTPNHVPGTENATVNHVMTSSQALNMGSGTYTYDFYASATFSGSGTNLNGGTIHIRSGATLTMQGFNEASADIIIDVGGTLNVTGNILNNHGKITVNGTLTINGSYDGNASDAVVEGTGTFTTTGHMNSMNGGTIFGVANASCSTGCNASTLSGCSGVTSVSDRKSTRLNSSHT